MTDKSSAERSSSPVAKRFRRNENNLRKQEEDSIEYRPSIVNINVHQKNAEDTPSQNNQSQETQSMDECTETYKKQVLVVDDNAAHQAVTTRMLESLQRWNLHNNAVASDGEMAYQLMIRKTYDLVLMDNEVLSRLFFGLCLFLANKINFFFQEAETQLDANDFQV